MSEQREPDVRYHPDRLRAQWVSAKREGTLCSVIHALYGHEINVGFQGFWDNGWDVWFGDDMNGKRAEQNFQREDFDDIPAWLIEQAERLYPTLSGGL